MWSPGKTVFFKRKSLFHRETGETGIGYRDYQTRMSVFDDLHTFDEVVQFHLTLRKRIDLALADQERQG